MDYKEKLKLAKEALESGSYDKNTIEYIFPELKEVEDEKMWKLIKRYAQYNISDMALEADHITREQLVSWLEKQGEQKPVDKVEPKFHPGDIVQYITDSTDRRKIEEIDTFCNMYHTDSSPIMFEIEDEWKVVVNAEDVENVLFN